MFDFRSNWQASPCHGAGSGVHGDAQIISGFVHPPTEIMFQVALLCVEPTTTVKGLEGSCDLPRERTAIIGISSPSTSHETSLPWNACTWYPVITALCKNVPWLDFSAGGRDAVVARQTFRTDANRSLERRILLVA